MDSKWKHNWRWWIHLLENSSTAYNSVEWCSALWRTLFDPWLLIRTVVLCGATENKSNCSETCVFWLSHAQMTPFKSSFLNIVAIILFLIPLFDVPSVFGGYNINALLGAEHLIITYSEYLGQLCITTFTDIHCILRLFWLKLGVTFFYSYNHKYPESSFGMMTM